MNNDQTIKFVDEAWASSILPAITEFVAIPNLSPAYDADWQTHGHMERAVELITTWCSSQDLPGASVSIERLPGRTPVLLIDVPGDSEQRVLLYGHYDKQPEMTGWRDGLSAWSPVLDGDRLYGRGSADDGYAVFASITALSALRQQRLPHAHCVILIEGCEESGSFDLPFYLDALSDRIGTPNFVVGLDSGCGNYDQLWGTTSLRGLLAGSLSVELLREGVHSGDASGVIPSSFRVMRQLLSRIEDEETGEILPPDFHVDVPEARLSEADQLADILGDDVFLKYLLYEGVEPANPNPRELILNRTWRPALSITGADGLPPVATAGNVLRPRTALQLSLRIPPTLNPDLAAARLKQILETDPPYGAQVHFEPEHYAPGWDAPPTAPWLQQSIEGASRQFFGREAAYMGEGGTIPFMGMLGNRYPEAQFFITGVLGPQSNAHGPNEFLHLPTARRLTCVLAQVLVDHYTASFDAP